MSDNHEAPAISNILIVDDHPLFQEALCELIQRESGWRVCGKAAGIAAALRLVEETHPDLVIVDISLGAESGIDLIKHISTKHDDLPMLVVSMHDESLYCEKAMQAGAMGYVMKHEPPKTVKLAIEDVLAGKMFLSHKMAMTLVAKHMHGEEDLAAETTIAKLSDREMEVLRLLGQGKSARQIAQELKLSVATIHSFRARIKEKLGLKSSTELLLHAVNWVKEQSDRNSAALP